MQNNPYHHGDLKQNLITQGLALMNRDGIEGFSIRKVADLCGVSHAAPYRHFKNKDELIHEIGQSVWTSFSSALSKAVEEHPDDPTAQIVEMGVRYVRFLVEHPEYRFFIFSSDQAVPIDVGPSSIDSRVAAFNVFRRSAVNYLTAASIEESLHAEKTILMWSTVHGMALLIANKNLVYDGDYLAWVESMLHLYLT